MAVGTSSIELPPLDQLHGTLHPRPALAAPAQVARPAHHARVPRAAPAGLRHALLHREAARHGLEGLEGLGGGGGLRLAGGLVAGPALGEGDPPVQPQALEALEATAEGGLAQTDHKDYLQMEGLARFEYCQEKSS